MAIRLTRANWRAGALAALALLSPGLAAADDEEDHDRVHRLVQSGAIVPLERIIERLRAGKPGRMLEAELEDEGGRYIYEIEWIDTAGEVSKQHFDAGTGEPIAGDTQHEKPSHED